MDSNFWLIVMMSCVVRVVTEISLLITFLIDVEFSFTATRAHIFGRPATIEHGYIVVVVVFRSRWISSKMCDNHLLSGCNLILGIMS